MRLLKSLFYGPAGNGKTTLLATAFEDERFLPMLIIDFEGGVDDAIGSKVKEIKVKDIKPNMEPGIYHIRVTEWITFQNIYDVIDDNTFKCIAIDSLTEINQLNLMSLTNKSIGKKPVIQTLKMPQIQDYGNSSFQMSVLVRSFRDLNCNFIATAHATRSISKITGEESVGPNMIGQLKDKIAHIFGQVGYLGIHPGDDSVPAGTRVLIVKPTEGFVAKFRDEQRIVEDMIIAPTLPKLLDRVNGITS